MARKHAARAKTASVTKLFVLDTNVLLHDPTSVYRFEEHDIFLPIMTLEELDNNKKGLSEVARNARQVTRLLDETKAAIKATGRDEIVGELALVTVGLSERVALDQKLVKAILTSAQIAECSKTTLVETIRVKSTAKIEVLS